MTSSWSFILQLWHSCVWLHTLSSKHFWDCHQCVLHVTATCYLCTGSTFLWMCPDNRCRKNPRKVLHQPCLNFGIFFLFLLHAFVNLSSDMRRLLLLIFWAQFFAHLLRTFWYTGSHSILDRGVGVGQTGRCSFVLFTFLLLLRGVKEGFESPLGKHGVMLLLK